MSAENSGKPLGGRGSAPNPAGVPLSWWEGACCTLPKNPPRSGPSASIFGPSGLIRQSLPTVFIPPMFRGLDKTLAIAILSVCLSVHPAACVSRIT